MSNLVPTSSDLVPDDLSTYLVPLVPPKGTRDGVGTCRTTYLVPDEVARLGHHRDHASRATNHHEHPKNRNTK